MHMNTTMCTVRIFIHYVYMTTVYWCICLFLCIIQFHVYIYTKQHINYTHSYTKHHTHTQVGHKNRNDPKKPLSLQDAISVVKEVFIIATERDIYTGDCVEIKVIRKEGVTTEKFNLKHD